MVSIQDVVEAILFVEKNPKAYGNIYHVTDQVEYTPRKIYEDLCKLAGKEPRNWSVPIGFFQALSKLNNKVKFKLDKLFGDEFYSSKKIEKLGFKVKYQLRDLIKEESRWN